MWVRSLNPFYQPILLAYVSKTSFELSFCVFICLASVCFKLEMKTDDTEMKLNQNLILFTYIKGFFYSLVIYKQRDFGSPEHETNR